MKKTVFAAMFTVAILMVAGVALAAPSLKVETDKQAYFVGEDVQISLVNNWNDYIYTGVGYHVTTSNGELVWNIGWIQMMVGVPPGGSLDYTWNQTYQMSSLGDDYAQVEPGHYVINANHGNGQSHIWIEEPAEVAFETVEQGAISYVGYGTVTDSTYLVIRDDTAWKDFWTEHKSGIMPTPEKPYIDFSSEMVIVAIHGSYNTNGAGIVIESVYDYGAHWETNVVKSYFPGQLPVVTNPYHIVKTAYTDLPVEFAETIV